MASPDDGHGGVVRGRKNAQQFEREDGSRWTPLGYEIDWLWALGMQDSSATTVAPVEHALEARGPPPLPHQKGCTLECPADSKIRARVCARVLVLPSTSISVY